MLCKFFSIAVYKKCATNALVNGMVCKLSLSLQNQYTNMIIQKSDSVREVLFVCTGNEWITLCKVLELEKISSCVSI